MNLEFAQNPAYVSFERHLRHLHELIASGKGESAEADSLRELMSADHRLLSADEEDRLDGLSEDLYSLAETPIPTPQIYSSEAAPLFREIQRAREHDDWTALLVILRRIANRVPATLVAFLRYQAYANLNHAETAYLFLQRSVELDPADFRKQYLLLAFSLKSGRGAEAIEKADRLLHDPNTVAPLIILAAHVRFQSLRNLSRNTSIPVVREIVAALESAMLTKQALSECPNSLVVLGYSTLALCREKLGDVEGAMEAFDRALKLDPASETLRVARGLMLARHDMERAALEFEEVAAGASHLFHPYLFLAPYELGKGHWEKALYYAEQLLSRTEDQAIEAEALNWRAIALFEMQRPWQDVEALFRRAEVLDPVNPRIFENFEHCRAAKFSPSSQRSVVNWSRPGPDDFPDPTTVRQFVVAGVS